MTNEIKIIENNSRGNIVNTFFREDRSLPYDVSLEKAVLGSMLLEEESRHICIERLAGVSSVFYSQSHQWIFRAIYKLYESGASIDVLTVSNFLKPEGVLENIGGETYLLELQNSITTTANIEKWCEILSNLAALRKMISVCAVTVEKCYDADIQKLPELLSDIENSILEVRDVNKPVASTKLSEHIIDAVQYLEKLHNKNSEATGIATGLPSLDHIIMGLKNQEMIVIAARPSIGKTSLAVNIAAHIGIIKKLNVAFFSLEMSAEQLTRRFLCGLAEISERDFYEKNFDNNEFGVKWAKITRSASELNKANIFIDPTPNISINELRAKALRLKKKHKIDVVFVDYLQLMRADINKNDNRQVEVSRISIGIKSLAKELNIPVVVLAQLNRQAEQQDKPRLSHLRESGAIEQDADIVMFLHRERDPQKDTTVESIESELIVEKNRNGQTGIANLLFFPKIMTFRSRSRYGNEIK